MTAYATLAVTDTGPVRTLTLQRPERRNALTSVMIQELTEAINAFDADESLLVMILTGAGESFCSGLDLEELQRMAAHGEAAQRESSDSIATLMRTLYRCVKPTIAAVNGAAVAGGMGLATICDFTYAVPDAKFGYPEVKIGFIPAIVSAFLRNQVGEKQARDLLLTGRLISAVEAMRMGLVTGIIDPSSLLQTAHEAARLLLKNSPASLSATKTLLLRQSASQIAHDLDAAAEANAMTRQTDDFREGLSAFLEKRKPSWTLKT